MQRDARTRIDASRVDAVARKLRVAFVLAPRFTLTAFAGFVDALRLAADDGDRSRRIHCDWDILGRHGEAIVSSCGAAVQPSAEMSEPSRYDYIVVVGGLLHGGQKVLPGTFSFLRQAARNRVPLVGLCTAPLILRAPGCLKVMTYAPAGFTARIFSGNFRTCACDPTGCSWSIGIA